MQNLMPKLFAITTAIAAITLSASAQTVKSTITLPGTNFGGVVANPVTNLVYAVSRSGSADNDTITVIDGKKDTIVASISVPAGAYLPAVNILTNRIYVASCDDLISPTPCFVTVIDGKKNTVITSVPVTTILNGFLAGIAVNPVTNTIYVADNVNGDIAIIDGKSNTLKGTIDLSGAGPWGLALDPLCTKLYVTLGGSVLDIINTRTEAINQVSIGDGTLSFNAAVDPFSGQAFVTNSQATPSTTAVLDRTGKVTSKVPVGKAPYGVDVDPLTHLAFVANVIDNNISVFDTKTKKPTAIIENTFATFVSVNPITRKVYGAGNGVVTVSQE